MEGGGDATIATIMLPEAIQRLLHGHRVMMTLIPDDANCGFVMKHDPLVVDMGLESLGPRKQWRLQGWQENALHAQIRVLPMPIDKRNEVWQLYLAMKSVLLLSS